MACITLTTDFGLKDYSVGAVKGAIYSQLGQATIVDISHLISPFNIAQATYTICNAYQHFPKGSIHIIGVDTQWSPENKHIAVLLDGHYFVCADNGIMSLITTEIVPEKIIEIQLHNQKPTNFPTLDVFAQVACHIARGGTLELIGKPLEQLKQISNITPIVEHNQSQISGSVIYIDNYGNVVTNINRKLFETVGKARPFEVIARNHIFKKIHNRYVDCIDFRIASKDRLDEGKGLVLFNTNNYLEIAVYKSNLETVGGASSLFGLNYRDTVVISFDV